MWLGLVVGVFVCFTLGQGQVVNIVAPPDSCLRVNAASVNVRNAACGSTVIGSATQGQFYRFRNNRQWCTLSGTQYHFHEVDFNGQSGWMAGEYLTIDASRNCGAVTFPDPEFRAMWIATVYNIDWPRSATSPPAVQEQELEDYMAVMEETNLNAVVFQVRPVGDAMYNSDREPWSRYLTGTQGEAPNPFYDPLEVLVEKAHSRGFEVHTWLNPYRANMAASCTSGLAANHMAMQWPQHAKVYGNYCWMDPGAEPVIQRLLDVVEDIITNYDVDGIHFDDYFYPYPTESDFPDDDTYNAYVQGGGSLSRPDWRRDNVNRMIQRVYNLINDVKPNVAFTVSPFGIYRPGHAEGMPPPIAGLDPYTALFADPKLWYQQGWVDIMAPQLYWKIDPPAQSYPTLLDWWVDVNTAGRHIYAGIGLYRLNAGDGDWAASEFENQIDVSRCYYNSGTKASKGHIHYSAKFFRDNTKGIKDLLRANSYPNKASVPPYPWKALEQAKNPEVRLEGGEMLTWEQDPDVKFWAVYKQHGSQYDLIRTLAKMDTSIVVTPGVYVIKAVSYANEQSSGSLFYVVDPNSLA